MSLKHSGDIRSIMDALSKAGLKPELVREERLESGEAGIIRIARLDGESLFMLVDPRIGIVYVVAVDPRRMIGMFEKALREARITPAIAFKLIEQVPKFLGLVPVLVTDFHGFTDTPIVESVVHTLVWMGVPSSRIDIVLRTLEGLYGKVFGDLLNRIGKDKIGLLAQLSFRYDENVRERLLRYFYHF